MDSNASTTILGLDPGTRFLGAAVLRGRELVAYGVHTLKNGERPYDVIGQARRVVFEYIERHGPQVVAIEAPYLIASKRAAVLSTLAQELHGRSKELGLCVRQLAPEEVRRKVTGNPRATKYEVAQQLVADRFPELKALAPARPAPAALWLRPRERYWLHMFDALALAQAVLLPGDHTIGGN
jgi:Holliday junction resolvasome RuvABC endonuclease subunit